MSLLLLAACDEAGPANTIDTLPDAPVPDVLEPEPHVVTVEYFGSFPIFVMYREGTGPWQAAEETPDGYTLRIRDAYELVTVCGDATVGFDVGFEASTYEESQGRTIVPCYAPTDPSPQTVAVTGTMVQPGEVLVGSAKAKGTAASWIFAVDVPQGTHNVIAVSSDRIEIRRNLTVTGPIALPEIDVAADGQLMASTALMVTGTQADESLSTRTGISAGNAPFRFLDPTPGTVARVAPQALLMAGDTQFIWFSAQAGTSSRSGFARHQSGDTLAFTLLPRLTGIQFGTTSASWSSPLPDGVAELYLYAGANAMHGTATPGWLGSRTELALDTAAIPGFKPEWGIGSAEYREFSVRDRNSDVSLATTISELLMMSRGPRRAELPHSRALRYERRAAAAK